MSNLLSKKSEVKEESSILDRQRSEFLDMYANRMSNDPNAVDEVPLESEDDDYEDYMDDKPNFDVLQNSDTDEDYLDVDEFAPCNDYADMDDYEEEENVDISDYGYDDKINYSDDDEEYEDDDEYYNDDYPTEDDDIFEDGFLSFENAVDMRKTFTEKTEIKKEIVKESSDDTAKDELRLFIDNDSDIYKRSVMPAVENMKRKIANGKFDPSKAPKLWLYVVDAGAKKYAKEFANPSDWNKMFAKDVRMELSSDLAEYYTEEINLGNY